MAFWFFSAGHFGFAAQRVQHREPSSSSAFRTMELLKKKCHGPWSARPQIKLPASPKPSKWLQQLSLAPNSSSSSRPLPTNYRSLLADPFLSPCFLSFSFIARPSRSNEG